MGELTPGERHSGISSLQGWISGALEGLGAITGRFGSRIASSLAETVSVVQRLMRKNEVLHGGEPSLQLPLP